MGAEAPYLSKVAMVRSDSIDLLKNYLFFEKPLRIKFTEAFLLS